ncbi:MAG: sigma-70 family RNA polymerase sigma factor [bacterium]|nr:sigma-70 family RNA polymerase sigma factor [bacterium]
MFRFLRREGRDEDAARELTQEFFARVLAGSGFAGAERARGRFRSFLLGAVKHFLGDLRDREHCQKRGGGRAPESLDAPRLDGTDTAAGLQVPDPSAPFADVWFDRQWALTLMDRALTALEDDFVASGKERHFGVLKPGLLGAGAELSPAVAANALGLTEGAAKVAIHRFRKRFREFIRAEIAQTLGEGADVDGELRYLVEVWAGTDLPL